MNTNPRIWVKKGKDGVRKIFSDVVRWPVSQFRKFLNSVSASPLLPLLKVSRSPHAPLLPTSLTTPPSLVICSKSQSSPTPVKVLSISSRAELKPKTGTQTPLVQRWSPLFDRQSSRTHNLPQYVQNTALHQFGSKIKFHTDHKKQEMSHHRLIR